MKILKPSDNPSLFKPFVLALKLESPEEVRLMFHVLNRSNLLFTLMSGLGYLWDGYEGEVAQHFDIPEDDIRESLAPSGVRI